MLRISPNEVSLNDLEASGIIYGQTSKFEKSEYFYRPFEDQAPNLFTIRDRQQHAQDKRLISHAFSRANIVQHQASIVDKAVYLMDRISQRVKDGQTIPLFSAFRCMTLDTISEFAFGRSIGALKLQDFESEVFDSIDKATGSVPFVSPANLTLDWKGMGGTNRRLTDKVSTFPNSPGGSPVGQLLQVYRCPQWISCAGRDSGCCIPRDGRHRHVDHVQKHALLRQQVVHGTHQGASHLGSHRDDCGRHRHHGGGVGGHSPSSFATT